MYATVHEDTVAELRERLHDEGYDLAVGMPFISEIPAVQAYYEHCRFQGTSHLLSEMFAWQQPPACMTDNVFMEGRVNGNQFEGAQWMGDWYAETARQDGVDIKGATYLHGLAAYPGDPKAWVRNRGDVQRVCESRGWGCQGAVNVKGRQPEHDPKVNVSVAPDIVERETHAAIAANPDLARRPFAEVAHDVTERIKPAWTGKKMPRKKLDLAA
jgi:hypothetical protein